MNGFRAAILGCIALILAACSGDEGIKVTRGVATSYDGSLIAYDVRGKGDTALVFIHCWACNRSFWKEQLDEFASDYKVVSMDLPGHGLSNVDRPRWKVSDLGRDVAAVVNTLKLRRVILIGHSMGGPVALAAAGDLPGKVQGIACVDTLHDMDKIIRAEELTPFMQALSQDFEGAMARMADATMAVDTAPELKTFIVEEAGKADKTAALGLMRSFIGLDLGELMQEAGVPVRCINASAPVTNIEGNQRFGDFDAFIMEGVGHFLQLEKPQAFNAHLRQILSDLNDNGSAS